MTCLNVNAGTTVLIYKPGIATSLVTGNVFDDFTKFAAAMAGVNGSVTGVIDDSVSAAIFPSSPTDIGAAATLVGANKDGSTLLTIPQGGSFMHMPDLSRINISHQSTLPAYTLGVSEFLTFNMHDTTLTAVAGSFMSGDVGTSQLTVNSSGKSAMVNGGSVVVDFILSADVNVDGQTNIGGSTFNVGAGGIIFNPLSPNVVINTTQVPSPTFGATTGGITSLISDVTTGAISSSGAATATVAAMSGSGGEVVIKCNELLWQSGLTPHFQYGGTNLCTMNWGGGLDLEVASTNGLTINCTASGMALGISSSDYEFQVASSDVVRIGAKGLGIGNSSPGTGSKVLLIQAGTAPSVSSNNAQLYVISGALKCIGGSGTVTTLAAAHPHCPNCGRDFALEWEKPEANEKFSVCMPCLAGALEKVGIPRGSFMIESNLQAAS